MEVFDAPAHYYPSSALTLDELSHWIAFNRILGIGPVTFRSLLEFFSEDVAAAWKADSKTLTAAGLGPKTIESFLKQRAHITPAQELEKLERMRVRVITWKDKSYPTLLRKTDNAPAVLYIAGILSEDDQFAVGVVGTRRMTNYGRQVTERLAGDLAKHSVTIVSGLALGVDTIAHTSALEVGGRTLAVMGCGLDTIYPVHNQGLARRIVESGQGALISEFPLGVKTIRRFLLLLHNAVAEPLFHTLA